MEILITLHYYNESLQNDNRSYFNNCIYYYSIILYFIWKVMCPKLDYFLKIKNTYQIECSYS